MMLQSGKDTRKGYMMRGDEKNEKMKKQHNHSTQEVLQR